MYDSKFEITKIKCFIFIAIKNEKNNIEKINGINNFLFIYLLKLIIFNSFTIFNLLINNIIEI